MTTTEAPRPEVIAWVLDIYAGPGEFPDGTFFAVHGVTQAEMLAVLDLVTAERDAQRAAKLRDFKALSQRWVDGG